MSAVKVSFRGSNERSRHRTRTVVAFALLAAAGAGFALPANAAKTPQSAFTKPAPGIKPISVDGASLSFDDSRATFSFVANRNDWFAFDSSVGLSLQGPLGFYTPVAKQQVFQVPQTGNYRLAIEEDRESGLISVKQLPAPAATKGQIGTPMMLKLQGDRPEYGVIDIQGGVRYQLSTDISGGELCVSQHEGLNVPASRLLEREAPLTFSRNSQKNRGITTQFASRGLPGPFGQCLPSGESRTLMAIHDDRLTISLSRASSELDVSASILVKQIANDRVLGLDANSSARARSEANARTLIPLWGSAGERAVLGSPLGGRLRTYGEPWIEREGTQTTYLVPFQFRVDLPPYLAWGGTDKPEDYDAFIFRGDDAVFPAKLGEELVATNRAWMRSVVPFTLVQGRRYEVTLSGENLRNAGFALRDPNGRRTTSAGNWNYFDPDDTGDFTNVSTVLEARHGGNWVLEIDPRSASIVSTKIKISEIGGRVAYEPVTKVNTVLRPGETVDVDLLPGEWAQMNFVTGDRAELIKPVVQRYRNTTFDGTAADVTVWDPDGRLLYSNNKDLQEEVFTGRLGSETKSAENYVLLRPKTTYRMVVDPQGDLAGRFRLSVQSQAATQLVPIDISQKSQTLLPGQAGVIEVRNNPIGIAVTGEVCVTTSNVELAGIGSYAAAAPAAGDLTAVRSQQGGFCVRSQGMTLPPGVHTIVPIFDTYNTKKPINPVLSPAKPGFGSPVLSSITAPIGLTTKIPEGLHRVTVDFPSAHKLYRFEAKSASIVRMFDPQGIEVQAVGNSFEPLVAGTYELFVQSQADSSSERPSLVVGTEREPVREQAYTLGQKVSLDLINGETLLLRFTKAVPGWLNVRADAEQGFYDSSRNPASSYAAIGEYLVGLKNPSGYLPEAIITIDKPAKKTVAKKIAAKKAR
jgi:hypothetical protein